MSALRPLTLRVSCMGPAVAPRHGHRGHAADPAPRDRPRHPAGVAAFRAGALPLPREQSQAHQPIVRPPPARGQTATGPHATGTLPSPYHLGASGSLKIVGADHRSDYGRLGSLSIGVVAALCCCTGRRLRPLRPEANARGRLPPPLLCLTCIAPSGDVRWRPLVRVAVVTHLVTHPPRRLGGGHRSCAVIGIKCPEVSVLA